ncbi:retinol dehydrogenase 12-like [Diorhabda carinulata]|uniref:retinol dehydrogenase 12-like n=1 Tax=Diorhabda carinulata TaxID=1163345 RepID=UPI0025A1C90D|nr:retinol dehydrogenase 12-like [Diorhabda carinulata]
MYLGWMIISSFILIVSITKLLIYLRTGWCNSKICLIGKTVLVTGANTGIGYETALEFAKRGARVILACRDLIRAEQAKNRIISLTKNDNVIVKELNLVSLKSVRDLAEDIKKTEDKLHILVNNAGVGFLKHKYTDDGLQILMQINYFGPFLLTVLLLDLLKRSGSSRIINVASYLAKIADLTPENINKPKEGYTNYGNSKLGNILFTMKLARLLKNSDVTVYSVHPGVIATNIFNFYKGIGKLILNFLSSLFFKTPEQGAQTTLYTALEQGIEKYSGGHFEECSLVSTYAKAKDPDFSDKIWNKTIEILDIEKAVEDCLFSD